MLTTVHIPDPLLKSVDRRAKALGISRNRLVVRALEQAGQRAFGLGTRISGAFAELGPGDARGSRRVARRRKAGTAIEGTTRPVT
jgi:hypothetical protein